MSPGLLSVGTLIALVFGVWAAHSHCVTSHRRTMIWIFLGAVVVARLFTLVLSRLMHSMVFGAS